uniref:Uncharacterized protein n=1 Tax=Arundo donax TaxID=35708 RepID=A0A0A9C471_ARUDO
MELVRRRLPPWLGGDSQAQGKPWWGSSGGPCGAGKQRRGMARGPDEAARGGASRACGSGSL